MRSSGRKLGELQNRRLVLWSLQLHELCLYTEYLHVCMYSNLYRLEVRVVIDKISYIC